MENLTAVSAIVTGGASGLGAAVARRLAAMGVRVAVFDRDKQGGERVAGEIGGLFVAVDVASDGAVEEAIATAVAAQGAPRIVVNCAGVAAGGGLLTHRGAEQFERFDRLFKINVYGTFSIMRHVIHHIAGLPPLEHGERGVIVNTASIAAFEGGAGQTVYAASKAAIAGLTLPAARDLAKLGIRVCAIAPGVFDTPILGPSASLVASLEREIPFPHGRGDPAAFAGLVEHICRNPFLNGEVIRIDGALRIPAYP